MAKHSLPQSQKIRHLNYTSNKDLAATIQSIRASEHPSSQSHTLNIPFSHKQSTYTPRFTVIHTL